MEGKGKQKDDTVEIQQDDVQLLSLFDSSDDEICVTENLYADEGENSKINEDDEDFFRYENIVEAEEGQPNLQTEDYVGYIDDPEASAFSHDYVSPDGTPYWTPQVDETIIPKIGSVFRSLEAAIRMYKAYAVQAGFVTRYGTSRKINGGLFVKRYVFCNKEGKPNVGVVDTMDIQHSKFQRRKDMFRTECKAKICFRRIDASGSYVVHSFVERHNHVLINKDSMYLSKTKRQLDYSQQTMIHNLSNQNIGGVKAYRILSSIQGGYGVRGGLETDYKNASKHLNCFIAGRDATFLVDKMNKRKKYLPNFTFETRLNVTQLDAVFWADEAAKYNFNMFGDVVSFDATYNTNRYNMVFVPFTGIDNHKRAVTFGAGLLSREDASSYTWLLETWLKAFGKQPKIVLSDQDPALKKAVSQVLPLSHHRLCMWHITAKLPKQVSAELAHDPVFKKRFNSLVWNSKIDPLDFEIQWDLMMKDFNLYKNEWLQDKFRRRRDWIPAYFKNVPLSGLMRTTSMSESQNWSFQNSSLSGSFLINLLITFEGVMERQRHKQCVNDYKTSTTYPKYITFLPYEPQAAKEYTRVMFYQVQEEIFQSEKLCFQKSVHSDGSVDTFVILEKRKNITTRQNKDLVEGVGVEEYHFDNIMVDSEYKVIHSKVDESFCCTCNHFEHVGILCRHIFCVCKYYSYEKIPDKYILKRWRRDVIPTQLLRMRLPNSTNAIQSDKTALEIFSIADECVSTLSSIPDKMLKFVEDFKKLKNQYLDELPTEGILTRDSFHERILGVTIPEVVDILDPSNIRNKGCGSRGKRLKSQKEMMMKENMKRKRLCAVCKQYVTHDKRNCPQKEKQI